MKIKKNSVEILAPAGSVEGMVAAFNAGADACYIGGNRFGARKFAKNPDEKELLACIDHAHLHDKRLYLTVNTLLKENELKEELYHYIKPYYEEGLDGVLVQDLGVMKFIHDYFPELPIHASTQMTICDTAVIDVLKRFDVERLVLSRELSLDEIHEFHRTSDIELEVFVHGALCVCYSGQCLLSALKGGRSGNRGECAQPCRLAYNTYSGDKRLAGNKYTLSPKDMCGLRAIPDLIEAGVNSFKIEGRMKKPEYAALTAALYRQWTDVYYKHEAEKPGEGKRYFNSEEGEKKLSKAIFELADIYNRGGFSEGYFFMHNGAEMMSTKRPNHYGIKAGKIFGIGNTAEKNIMKIRTDIKLYPHDVLEVRDETAPDKPVYEFTLGNGVDRNDEFEARFTPGLKVERGMSIYRTRNQTLINTLGKFVDGKAKKRKISAKFIGVRGKLSKLTLTCGKVTATAVGAVCEKAETSPLTHGRLEEAFSKLGDTDYELERIDILASNIFLPMSAINDLRRQAAENLNEAILSSFKRKPPFPYTGKMRTLSNFSYEKPAKLMVMISSMKQLEAAIRAANSDPLVTFCMNLDLLGTHAFPDAVAKAYEARVPVFIRFPSVLRAVTRNNLMNFFKTELGRLTLSKTTGFLLRNLEEYDLYRRLTLINSNISVRAKLIADTGLYVFNSEAYAALKLIGIDHYSAGIEQDIADIRDVRAGILNGSDAPERNMSVVVYGRQQLMTTAQCQWKLRNACKKTASGVSLADTLYIENSEHPDQGRLPVISDCESCLNLIFNDKPLDNRDQISELKALGAEFFRVDLILENELESEKIVKEFLSCLH